MRVFAGSIGASERVGVVLWLIALQHIDFVSLPRRSGACRLQCAGQISEQSSLRTGGGERKFDAA